jgi:sugar lactone lactonase YvrE
MRHFALSAGATVVFVSICTLLSCNQGERRAGSGEDARQARSDQGRRTVVFERGPTTAPSLGQKVITDAKVIENVKLATARGGPGKGKRDEKLKAFALFEGPLPTCFAFTSDGRLFVCFPRWGMAVNYTVAEVSRGGELVPFPSAEANQFTPDSPEKFDPRNHLVSVQSVVVDERDRVWLLDTGSVNMGPAIQGGAKMWGFEAKTGRRVKEIKFEGVLKPRTYLNDVRFDLGRGQEGTAYVTDSGEGGIIVVDLASGRAWRKLDGHPSVMADPNLTMMVEGEPLRERLPGQPEKPVLIHSDGIAISPDAKTLYWTPLTGRSIYACPTDLLADPNAGNDRVAQGVWKVADKPGANDGIVCDAQGRIYTTDFEDNSIRRFTPGGRSSAGEGQVVFQDERLLWPDCVWLHDGKLYVTANQLHRQGRFHGGTNLLDPPLAIFEYPIDAREIRGSNR